MAIPATTVEIGFDLSALGGPFFILDDPVQGVLDNTEYTLGGTLFYDVTEYVRSVSVRRGKSRQLSIVAKVATAYRFVQQTQQPRYL